MTVLVFAWLAGALSVLAPCVLPLLPIVLIGAARQGRFGPLALAGGLMASFTIVGVALATIGFSLGISIDAVRATGGAIMAGFGLILLMPRAQLAFAGALGGLMNGPNAILARLSPDGPAGNALLGALLGLVWAPCTGPTLGAALGMAAQSETAVQAGLVMAVFSLGAATPLLLLAYGSRQAIALRRERLARFAAAAKPAMGAILLIVGISVLSGFDKRIEAILTEAMPDWLIALTTRF